MTQLVTPYKAATLANEQILAAGLPAIRTQMVYNYTSQKVNRGEKPLIECVETPDGVKIHTDVILAWVAKYIAKKVHKGTPAPASGMAALIALQK